MKKPLIIIVSIVTLLTVGIICYYKSKTQNTRVFATRLMNVFVPYAEFNDVPLADAANRIWTETVSIDPYFAKKQMVVDLKNPDLHRISAFKAANCPTREWFNYFCQMTKTTYRIFDDVIYITDRGLEYDNRPFLFRAVEKVDFWVYLMVRRIGRRDPNDPFAVSPNELDEVSSLTPDSLRVQNIMDPSDHIRFRSALSVRHS
jgi:hypothetical protein